MRCILLHSTVSILIASAPDNHICLLAEEGLVAARTWLHVLVLLLLIRLNPHLLVLSKVALNFGCFVLGVRFGTTHALKVSTICLIFKRVRILVRDYFKQIKSVLATRLDLLRVASGFASTYTHSRGQ